MHVAQACSSILHITVKQIQHPHPSKLSFLLDHYPLVLPVLFPDLCYLASGGIVNKACCQLGPMYCMTDKYLYISLLFSLKTTQMVHQGGTILTTVSCLAAVTTMEVVPSDIPKLMAASLPSTQQPSMLEWHWCLSSSVLPEL